MVDHKELNTFPVDRADRVVVGLLARIAPGNMKRPEAARLESKDYQENLPGSDCLSEEEIGSTVSESRLERPHVDKAFGIVQVTEDSLRQLLELGWQIEWLAEG